VSIDQEFQTFRRDGICKFGTTGLSTKHHN